MAGHDSAVNLPQVQSEIRSYGVWEVEDTFTSIDQQDAVEDVISPIDFGDSKTSPNGLVSYDDTTKTFAVLKGGCFMIKSRLRAARVGGSSGESELFLQSQISINGGASWVNTGNSVDLKLDDTRQVEIFFDFAAGEFPTGALLRQVFARSSAGSNFGSLIAGTPSAALLAAGVSIAPAAQVTVYKLRDYNYS